MHTKFENKDQGKITATHLYAIFEKIILRLGRLDVGEKYYCPGPDISTPLHSLFLFKNEKLCSKMALKS